MASLVPADFDLHDLEPGERRVVTAFLDGLGEEWVVIPSVRIPSRGRDHEIDVLIASPDLGAICVEVKGGLVTRKGNTWLSYGTVIKDPATQALHEKYALIDYLGSTKLARRPFIAHAIALPDTVSPTGGFGSEAPRDLVFDRFDLEHPDVSVTRILEDRNRPMSHEQFEAFVQALRPDIHLEVSGRSYHDRARERIEASTRDRLSAVLSMDANRRALVEGGAGSGKTWLVTSWARRATGRGERTAVVCFNRPMADDLARRLDESGAVVDTFHGLAVSLLEEAGAKVPDDPDAEWWRKGVVKALRKKAKRIGTPFDTIIVDEAQDLRPRWLDALRALLDPDGPRRMLVALDAAQAIYLDAWTSPDEFARITLDVNLRNSLAIGKVCAHLGGPRPAKSNPMGADVRFERATGAKELRKRVERRVDELVEDGLAPSQIAVLTTRRKTRDALIATVAATTPLARWEDRGPTTVLCETVHRTKGLEWQAVIVATLDDPVDPTLLYVGASRPRLQLTLAGPDSLREAAGLKPPAA